MTCFKFRQPMVQQYFHYLLLISFLFWAVAGTAQDEGPVTKSVMKERDKTTKTHTLLDFDSTGYYALRFDKTLSYAELEHYDPKLKFLKTYVVTDKARKYVGVVNLSGRLFLLYFRYKENKKENTHEQVSLYAKPIIRDSFKLGADSLELITPFTVSSNYYRGNFAVSPDRSKVLVYDYEEEGDIEDVTGLTNKITVRVFDSKLQLLWKRKVNLSPNGGAKRMVAIKKLQVNNAGEVAVLTDVFRDKRSYSFRQVTADPTLFFIGKERNNFSLFKPNLGDFYFNQLDFTFDRAGNILWFGFYSKQRYYQQSGVFFIKINSTRTKVLVKKRHEFSRAQIATLLNKKKIGKKAEARSYRLINWRLTKEGGVVLSAEHQPPGNLSFKSHGVLVLRFDTLGDIKHFNYVYKFGEQPRKQRVFLSHYLSLEDDYTYLLFNRGLYSDGKAVVARINPEGTVEERQFYTYQTQQELFCPLLSFPLGKKQIFLCLQDRYFDNYRFALLDLKQLFDKAKNKQD